MKQKLLFLLFTFSIFSFGFAKTIYLATNGNDNNNGSVTSPYRTFNKAIAVMNAGDICIIKGGVYEQEFIINKSGTPNQYLTFRAADGEVVEIKATSYVNGWQVHQNNIYKTSVNMEIESRFRAVYHHGDYMDLARWPNNTDNNRWTIDCIPVTGGNGAYFTANNLPNIDWTGGLVYYLGAHSGASWTRPITASSTTRIDFEEVNIEKWPFSTHNPTTWRNYAGNERGQLYLFNKLEALDYAREWYYDSATNILYFQPADGLMPANNSVSYATRKYAIEIKGDYVQLDGLHVFGGSIKIDNRADDNQILNCTIVHGSEGHDDLSNTSAQVGEAAIEVLGDRTLIKGCTIDHSSVSGIVISGWAADFCTVEGNTIRNIDYVGIHASPIRTSGDGMKILKNTIYNAGRDGMYVAGTDCEVAYNDVSHSQIINSDSGVFYTVGNSNLKNNEIHHNWFHDATAPSYSHHPDDPAKAAGIYLDNNSKGYQVHHNVVWNVSWTGYQVNWNNTHLNFYHNTIWNAQGAMDSWVNGYTQPNNKIYNNYANTGNWHKGTGTSEFDIQNSPIFSDSPFENAAEQNFVPAAGSPLIDAAPLISGFVIPYKGALPDIGAYERGGTRWTAGVDAIEDTGEGEAWTVFDTQFTLQTNSESCPDSNNGSIYIKADITGEYVAEIQGNSYNFSKELTLENLAPSTYELCIALRSATEDKQCSQLTIQESNAIKTNTQLTSDIFSVAVLSGTPPYRVMINDQLVLETNHPNFNIPVHQNDQVVVLSKKECEGSSETRIPFTNVVIARPNPTQGMLHITVNTTKDFVLTTLHNSQSQLVYKQKVAVVQQQMSLDLSEIPAGIYFLKLANTGTSPLKIIKK